MGDSLMIIAGESSGDIHGAELAKRLLTLKPDLRIYGVGGERMKSAGVKLNFHIKDFSFLGFVEVIKHLSFIKKARNNLLKFIAENKIKLVVLIDYPGFNLNFAKNLFGKNIKVVYYISPQVWAWGKKRVKKIKKYVNRMIVVFPFEEKFYKEHSVNAIYVGHPLIEKFENFKFLTKETFYKKHKLPVEKEILAIFPGSRIDEVKKILPPIIRAALKLKDKFGIQPVISVADTIDDNWLKSIIPPEFSLIKRDNYNLMKHAKFGIIKSGTSTLEAAFLNLPMIVVYKTNYLTYLIGKRLVNLNSISMPNILAEKKIVRELIQNQLTEKNIFTAVAYYLNHPEEIEKLKGALKLLKSKFEGKKNASLKSAKLILDLLNA